MTSPAIGPEAEYSRAINYDAESDARTTQPKITANEYEFIKYLNDKTFIYPTASLLIISFFMLTLLVSSYGLAIKVLFVAVYLLYLVYTVHTHRKQKQT